MENPSGAVDGNSQNTPTANVPRTFSTFPLKYHFYDTHRFGEYHPHYVEDSVKNDKLPIRSSHNVMSYTLKAPLMQDITMYKDYFSVSMEAILPLNWEKFFDNPVRGDDVSNDVGPTVENFWQKVANLVTGLGNSLAQIVNDQSTTDITALQATLRYLVILEYFYSNGSLMASLGCHGAPYVQCWDDTLKVSFDKIFDKYISAIVGCLNADSYFTLNVDGYTYDVVKYFNPEAFNAKSIEFRHALSLIRDNPAFTITDASFSDSVKSAISGIFSNVSIVPVGAAVPFNTSRLWAYQLCCAHYYSNDHIDFVYSAELFRQLIGNYMLQQSGSGYTNFRVFTRNGITYQYDYLSAHFCSLFLSTYVTTSGIGSYTGLLTASSGSAFAILGYYSALFGYRRSLRYQDYFTGSRAQPLAVGSTGVTVAGNTVDVVDITRNIQRQRFLNAVNRVRHNFEGYLQGIFGGDVPAPDYHNPFFLASTQDTVFGQETENTGAGQLSQSLAITTNLRSNGSRYMLEIHSDRPCIVIGITHYDLPRVYGKSMEREFLHVNRFDMFNPFMQYIGDQPVYLQELGINPLGTNLSTMVNFAYSLRHMEYKQRYNQAAGGFIENLPGFAFLAVDQRGTQNTINPDWIRSVCSEFDSFYISLNGWSNGSYFHFIVDNYNDCSGQRPMAYAPSIL